MTGRREYDPITVLNVLLILGIILGALVVVLSLVGYGPSRQAPMPTFVPTQLVTK